MQNLNHGYLFPCPDAFGAPFEYFPLIHICNERNKMHKIYELAFKVLLLINQYDANDVFTTFTNSFSLGTRRERFFKFLFDLVLHLFCIRCSSCWNLLHFCVDHEFEKFREGQASCCSKDVFFIHSTFEKTMDCSFFLADLYDEILYNEFSLRFCKARKWVDRILNWVQSSFNHLYDGTLTSEAVFNKTVFLCNRGSDLSLYVSVVCSYCIS